MRLEQGAVALFRFDRGDDAVADLGDDEDAAQPREAREMSCVRPELDRDPPPHQRQSSSARASAI
jgi:hypothetical protein